MAWTGVAGKRVVITGATGGIGLAAAIELGRRGAELTIVGRDEGRAARAAQLIGGRVDVLIADLSSLAAVRTLAERISAKHSRVDVLVNNAGAVNAARELTGDGIERTWAVNHLAPFLLTNLLLERLRASSPARVITTASGAHGSARGIPFDDLAGERRYGPLGFARYGETKLANILMTRELARRLAGTGVEAFCFHPGFVASGFNRNNGRLMGIGMTLARPFARSPETGADTLVWLADSAEPEGRSGGYFVDRRPASPSRFAQDDDAARRLWDVSERQADLSSGGRSGERPR